MEMERCSSSGERMAGGDAGSAGICWRARIDRGVDEVGVLLFGGSGGSGSGIERYQGMASLDVSGKASFSLVLLGIWSGSDSSCVCSS